MNSFTKTVRRDRRTQCASGKGNKKREDSKVLQLLRKSNTYKEKVILTLPHQAEGSDKGVSTHVSQRHLQIHTYVSRLKSIFFFITIVNYQEAQESIQEKIKTITKRIP